MQAAVVHQLHDPSPWRSPPLPSFETWPAQPALFIRVDEGIGVIVESASVRMRPAPRMWSRCSPSATSAARRRSTPAPPAPRSATVDVVDSELGPAHELGAEHLVTAAAGDPLSAMKALRGADHAVSPAPFRRAYGSPRRRSCSSDGQPTTSTSRTSRGVVRGITVAGSIVGVDLPKTFGFHARDRMLVVRESRRLDDVGHDMGEGEPAQVGARIVFDRREAAA